MKIKDTLLDTQNEDNEELEFQHFEWLESTPRKATIRIPCEQYAFIEIETSATPAETIELYRHYSRLYQGGTGLPEKAFNDYLDAFICKDTPITADEYAQMNKDQQQIIQTIKRSIKRIKSRHE